MNIYSYWLTNENIDYNDNVNLFVDTLPPQNKQDGKINVLLLVEPNDFINLRTPSINYLRNGYVDFILTHDEYLLKLNDERIIKFEFGTNWVTKYDDVNTKIKKDGISFLCGSKRMMVGHLLRLKIEKYFLDNNKLVLFYSNQQNRHGDLIIGSDREEKAKLFEYKHSLVVENCKNNNWFTEKLIDCFLCKSIPIYWGCPNIDEYFNTKGMILFDNLDELSSIVDNIKDIKIDEKYIEENYNLAKKWIDYNSRINTTIKSLL